MSKPASGVAIADSADYFGKGQIQRFASPGLHAA